MTLQCYVKIGLVSKTNNQTNKPTKKHLLDPFSSCIHGFSVLYSWHLILSMYVLKVLAVRTNALPLCHITKRDVLLIDSLYLLLLFSLKLSLETRP